MLRDVPRCNLSYKEPAHKQLPHVVNFSGGRSSGMMLAILLDNELLIPDRGDVIIFNNTSCEHPRTYDFIRECYDRFRTYGVPMFWTEWQTYEKEYSDRYGRRPTYRLVNRRPVSKNNPNGYHWKGEVFEELLSWSGFVPNQFNRTCTSNLKMRATTLFLKDWFSWGEYVPPIGHDGPAPRIDMQMLYATHLRYFGKMAYEEFADKKAFVLSRPHSRPCQSYSNYSSLWRPIKQKQSDTQEFVGFIGLRDDEPNRVARVRNKGRSLYCTNIPGEQIYMPLCEDLQITRYDVNVFWAKQDFDLTLPEDGALSNCTFCFLKGVKNLKRVKYLMSLEAHDDLAHTPCDVRWWEDMERKYGTVRPSNKSKGQEIRFGFYGKNSKFSYERLRHSTDVQLDLYKDAQLPCACTE